VSSSRWSRCTPAALAIGVACRRSRYSRRRPGSHHSTRSPSQPDSSPGGPSQQYTDGRYYDPTTAQFLSVDPLVGITGAPYSYAGDNPLDGTDPTGLDCRNTDSCPPSTSYSQENGYSPSPGHMDNASPTPQNETSSSATSTTGGGGSSELDKKSEAAVSCPAGTTLQTMTPTTVPGASNEPQCVAPHSDSSWVTTAMRFLGCVTDKLGPWHGEGADPGEVLISAGAGASGVGDLIYRRGLSPTAGETAVAATRLVARLNFATAAALAAWGGVVVVQECK